MSPNGTCPNHCMPNPCHVCAEFAQRDGVIAELRRDVERLIVERDAALGDVRAFQRAVVALIDSTGLRRHLTPCDDMPTAVERVAKRGGFVLRDGFGDE